MINKLKKSNNKGFTIIEVMIVLAIAGLILLVVLLAVPALQRNSRNTTLKSDGASIAGAIAEYTSNNDGSLPLAVVQNATTKSIVDFCDASPCTTAVTKSTAKVQSSTTVNFETGAATATIASPGSATAANYAPDNVDVVFKASCNAAAGKYVYSSRQTAIFYTLETAGNTGSVKCIGG